MDSCSEPHHHKEAEEDAGQKSLWSVFLSTCPHVSVGRTVGPGHVCGARGEPPLGERHTHTMGGSVTANPSAWPQCHQGLCLMHLHQALPVCHLPCLPFLGIHACPAFVLLVF